MDQTCELTALTEQTEDWRGADFAIRLEERIIADVQLTGDTSRNGHRYSPAALQDAAALYARKPVFLDHAPNLQRPLDRSTRDLAGWVVEARLINGRIRGDLQLLDTEAGRTLLALMAAETPSVGMSHVVLARKSPNGTLVERIQDVISIDAVVFPATTHGFKEQLDETDLAHAELERLTQERDEWRKRCADLQRELLEHQLDEELSRANLPTFALTESLRARLRTTTDSQLRSRLIAEQREFVLRCRQRAPCSRPRVHAEDSETDATRRFVQAVRKK